MSRKQRAEICDPNEFHGVLIVDKPTGISSAKVVAEVKRIVQAKKVGHAGTLDPFAEGVLVCCINNATRLARFLLHGRKKYEAILQLGADTDTQDATGTVIAAGNPDHVSAEEIRTVFKRYQGFIEQLPPVYSALKHKGVPLYKLARRGQPVQKPPRRVYIADLEILEIEIPRIRFAVTCSAGTYIRTLSADIGKSLGCGGHLQTLRRIESSGFDLSQALTLTELREAAVTGNLANSLISMADVLRDMPEHRADSQLVEKIRHGRVLHKNDLSPGQVFNHLGAAPSYIKIVDFWNDLIAVLNCQKGTDKLDYCCVFSN